MAHTNKTLGIIGVFLSLLWLAACSSPAPTEASGPTPTFDLNPLRTEVAATVLAQVAHDLALTPSATPVPSLAATTPPTATSRPTQAPSATPGATSNTTPSTPAALASETPVPETENRAEWVSQTIPDDTNFAPSETFTMTWRLKNVGTSTWTAAYMLRFYSGDTFGAPEEILINQEVLPGATIDIILQMKAPAVVGKYQSVWVMSSESRSNFKEPVYLQILVALPATPTPTP